MLRTVHAVVWRIKFAFLLACEIAEIKKKFVNETAFLCLCPKWEIQFLICRIVVVVVVEKNNTKTNTVKLLIEETKN